MRKEKKILPANKFLSLRRSTLNFFLFLTWPLFSIFLLPSWCRTRVAIVFMSPLMKLSVSLWDFSVSFFYPNDLRGLGSSNKKSYWKILAQCNSADRRINIVVDWSSVSRHMRRIEKIYSFVVLIVERQRFSVQLFNENQLNKVFLWSEEQIVCAVFR